MGHDDLPAFLTGVMVELRMGAIEPSVALAMATLAKVTMQVRQELELERRVYELEQLAEKLPDPVPISLRSAE